MIAKMKKDGKITRKLNILSKLQERVFNLGLTLSQLDLHVRHIEKFRKILMGLLTTRMMTSINMVRLITKLFDIPSLFI